MIWQLQFYSPTHPCYVPPDHSIHTCNEAYGPPKFGFPKKQTMKFVGLFLGNPNLIYLLKISKSIRLGIILRTCIPVKFTFKFTSTSECQDTTATASAVSSHIDNEVSVWYARTIHSTRSCGTIGKWSTTFNTPLNKYSNKQSEKNCLIHEIPFDFHNIKSYVKSTYK